MLYKLSKVKNITSLSKSTIYRMIKNNEFPRPVHISSMRVGWRQADIDAFLDSLVPTE